MENNELNVNVEENNTGLMEYEKDNSGVAGLIGVCIGIGATLVGKKVIDKIKCAFKKKKEAAESEIVEDQEDSKVVTDDKKIVDKKNE